MQERKRMADFPHFVTPGRFTGKLAALARRVMRCVVSGWRKADGRTRTDDLLITNQLLYQLSYAGAAPYESRFSELIKSSL